MQGCKQLLFSFVLACVLFIQGCASHNAFLYNQAIQYYSYQQYTMAFDLFAPLARSGDPNAQYALGYLYYYGLGTVEDPMKAEYWLSQAALQGQPLARQSLAAIDESRAKFDSKPHKIVTIY